MAERVVVVGGGIAGILAARLARAAGHEVVLVEASPHAGGLLRSVEHRGHIFDHGTHIPAFTGDDETDTLLFDLPIDGGWREIDRLDVGCHFGGQLSDRGLPDLRLLDRATYAKAVVEILEAPGEACRSETADIELRARFGATVTELVFRPLLDRIYGLEPGDLAGVLRAFYPRVIALDRELTLLLKTVARLDDSLGFVDRLDAPPVDHRYPRRGGCGSWIDALMLAVRGDGTDVRLSTTVTGIDVDSRSVQLDDGSSLGVDRLLWTVAPALALRAARAPIPGTGPPQFVRVDLVHMVHHGAPTTPWHYVMNADPQGRTFRITTYANITGSAEPETRLTAEVLTPPGRAVTPTEDAVADVIAMGLAPSDVVVAGVDTITNGFPVWDRDFPQRVEAQAVAAREAIPWARFVGRSASAEFLTSSVLTAVKAALSESGGQVLSDSP